jgi:hypothetical protein
LPNELVEPVSEEQLLVPSSLIDTTPLPILLYILKEQNSTTINNYSALSI